MQTIYLDISNKGVVPTIYAKQGDVGRKFLAIINDGGVPYAIPEDASVSVWYQTLKNNNAGTAEGVSFEDNRVEISIDPVITTVSGDGILCLTISFANGNEISTWNIPYDVEVKPGSEPVEPPTPGVKLTAVLYTPQTLTDEQKAQARANIGAGSGGTTIHFIDNLDIEVEKSDFKIGDLGFYEDWMNGSTSANGIYEIIGIKEDLGSSFIPEWKLKYSLSEGYENPYDSDAPTAEQRVYFRGEYNNSMLSGYAPMLVTYEGSLYFTDGHFVDGGYPDSNEGWIKLTGTGDTGLVWRGEYDESKSYSKGNAVSYNGSSYICTLDNTPTAPDDSGADWELLAEKGYTPVKGTDYWTDEDKAEIKAYVDDAILGGAW